nr:transposase [Cardiobacterium hominis]
MIYVGLDISKDTIDVHLIDHLETWLKIDNNAEGWQSLLDLLTKYPEEPIRACCEYTGIYYLGVATALHEAGYRISVVNAYSIKHYARLMMRRTKTDRKDAELIADYLRVNDPPDWQPPAQELAQIKRLNRRLGQLVAMRTMEENRRQVADELCATSCMAIIDSIEAQIVAVEALLQNIIGGDAKLKEKQKLLMSIPGLGKKSAAILLPEVAEIDRFPTPKTSSHTLACRRCKANPAQASGRRATSAKWATNTCAAPCSCQRVRRACARGCSRIGRRRTWNAAKRRRWFM